MANPTDAPDNDELGSIRAWDALCKVAAIPVAAKEAWIVPVPGTTAPNVDIAAGTHVAARTPKTGAAISPEVVLSNCPLFPFNCVHKWET